MTQENLNKKAQLDAEIAFLAQRETEERDKMTRKYLTGEGEEEAYCYHDWAEATVDGAEIGVVGIYVCTKCVEVDY